METQTCREPSATFGVEGCLAHLNQEIDVYRRCLREGAGERAQEREGGDDEREGEEGRQERESEGEDCEGEWTCVRTRMWTYILILM